ncbi:hypothetical protein HK097_011263 [Rhizophlyctis rosea]|uniref:Uncharacterized protein n=1 Tax=Rhizophlyctis rosea TaxID=64517 RepID=A0AAD5SGU5_9FUNG|nr:hypothetical protein HK097_011263 [Rhizophlyctis rosea]
MKLNFSTSNILSILLFLNLTSAVVAVPKGGGGGRGGGGASSGGRSSGGSSGGSTSSPSRGSSGGGSVTKPFSGAPAGTAGRSIPRTPTWSSSTNRYRGGGVATFRRPIAGAFLGFFLGYIVADTVMDAASFGNYWQRCDSCRYIREGVSNCANIELPYANSTNQQLPANVTNQQPELDQECYCPQINYDLYDQCFQCESRIPSNIQQASRELRDSCDTFLADYIEDGSTSAARSSALASVSPMALALAPLVLLLI